MLLTRDEEFRFLTECLRATGVRPDTADPAAEQMVEADLRGYASHGLIRLAGLIQGVQKGVVNPDPRIRTIRDRPTGRLINGVGGLGASAVREATPLAMSKAWEPRIRRAAGRTPHYPWLVG